MADFEPLLDRMLAGLPDPSPTARQDVYERARAALLNAVEAEGGGDRGGSPELDALDAAIARVEARQPAEGTDGAAAVQGTVETLPPPEPDAGLATAVPASPPVDERRRFAFNAAAGGAANLVKVGVQLLLLPVMARLLGPAEFGLYALALPTISFFTTLADGGLGASLAREKETETAVWSTAFWTLLASCTLMAVVAIGGGFVLADVSGQPRLAGIMALLSLSFPLLALTALPGARLVRRGNLVVHSVADLVSTTIGASAAVGLALLGAGAWALAFQYVLGWSVTCLILNAAAFERPTFEFHLAALKPHAATGGSLIGSRLSELFGRQVENLLFGRVFGAANLGSYTFANQVSRFLCEAAGNPIWGALYSHALREDARSIEPLHATLSRLLASALFPVAALLAASAPQVFDVVLGSRWAPAAAIVQIVVPFYALNVVAAQCGALLLANGRSGSLFWALSGLSAGRIVAVAVGGFLAGPLGVAGGRGAANTAYAAAMFAAIGPVTGTRPWSLLSALLPCLAASTVAGVVCHTLIGLRPEGLAWTVASVGLGGVTFLAALMMLQGRRIIADAFAIRRVVFSRR
jgi:PST family polysaccharide transporter